MNEFEKMLSDMLGVTKVDYLGDGVYSGTDGYHVWLVTWDGYKVTNKIALDPNVQVSYLNYIKRISE